MSQVKVEIVNITPDMAAKYLSANVQNRTISKSTVKAYSEEMKHGRWHLTGQGISFYDNGVLADGQHRLMAIVNSKCTIPMVVVRGLLSTSITGIDQHRARSARDSVNMANGYNLSTSDTAVIRLSFGLDKMTASLLDALYLKVSHELNFVNSLFKGGYKAFQSSPIKTALLLAYMKGVNRNDLEKFVAALVSGDKKEDRDYIPVLLRENILFKGSQNRTGSDREDLIKKTQWCFDKYRNEASISRLVTPKDLVFKKLSV